MIRRRDLVRALGEHGLADWVVVEHDQDIGIADSSEQFERTEHRLFWLVTVHHDAPTGRGSAHVVIDAAGGDAEAAIREIVTLARASVGPAWVTQPAAAAAHVRVDDDTLGTRPPAAIASEIIRSVRAPFVRSRVIRERVSVVTRQGLHAEWPATELRAEVLVTSHERSLRVVREARRIRDLDIADAVRAAAADADLLASATPLAPGPCTLVLRADAMLHDGLGVWATLIPQADAIVERQGLTRYREGMPIALGSDKVPEPLGVTSDGAIDHALLSAPLGDQGEAVRHFPLVERGLSAGLALAPREAALRGRDPNGGARNLVVTLGSWSGKIDGGAARTVEAHRLRSLTFDPFTGDASLELSLCLEHADGSSRPTTGGAIRIDMIAALASARRSSQRLTRGAYAGPDSIAIDGVEVIS